MISPTPGLGGLGDFGDWWTEPIVFQKFAVWTLLWEILGLGAGSMPLTFRFMPLIGGAALLAAAGDGAAAAVAGQGAADRGTTRTLARRRSLRRGARLGALPARSPAATDAAGDAAGRLDPAGVGVLLGFLVLLGLRDKVSFLGARPEIYAPMLVVFLFPLDQWIVAWQFVFICIWWGAASSKLNRHFPFVVSVMISNTPWNRGRRR